ncbi:DUF1990 family protein [Stieleria varia]|uniref:DUF1990 domain-containing protein n=1 Tax=Stieleria varia TaxID=2528005 RepID=A0A5C6BDJ1_9BACT|nr:DUF1990 domain-containing protein [Stieleria varia]TWU08514.1 hypothetical protein Pla52n_10970 [Stieleria varia]
MFTLTQPNDKTIAAFLAQQSRQDLNYPDTFASLGNLPASYDHNVAEVHLGNGEAIFAAALTAFRHWRQFDVGWVEALPRETPIEIGQNIAIRARVFRLWTLAACRIVDVMDEYDSDTRRFAFSIGTLPAHPEQGEERFEINQSSCGRVTYRVTAFFRPNSTAATVAWPYLRYRFNLFRRQSAGVIRREVIRAAA